MKKIIIFGSGDIAELSYFYFKNDSEYDVVSFTLDEEFIKSDNLFNLPMVPFNNIQDMYSPKEYKMFIALSYSKINLLRKQKYLESKEKGYKLVSYISSKATILNDNVIGDNCFILEDNTIQPFVKIGNNVTLWSGNHMGHHSIIKDHCFIASHVVVSGGCEIGEQTFIGVNATLRDHIKIGDRSVIGAGVLLLNDTEEDSLYIGQKTEKAAVPSSKLKKI